MRQAAAERAAIADRIMRYMTHHVGQKLSQRPFANRPVECGVTNAGADDKFVADDGNAVERFDAVYIDKVCGLSEPERHGRNEALAAGEDLRAGPLEQHWSEMRAPSNSRNSSSAS